MTSLRQSIRALLADGQPWELGTLALALGHRVTLSVAHRAYMGRTYRKHCLGTPHPDLSVRLESGRRIWIAQALYEMCKRGQLVRVRRGVYRLTEGCPIDTATIHRRAIRGSRAPVPSATEAP